MQNPQKVIPWVIGLGIACCGIGCDDDPIEIEELKLSNDRSTCNAPCEIAFKAVSHGDASVGKSLWYFGDGSSAEGENVTHLYSQSGHYKVTAKLNDVLSEQTLEIEVAEPMDVRIDSMQLSKREISNGESFDVLWTIYNLGADAADGLTAGIYLSTDRIFDASDVQLSAFDLSLTGVEKKEDLTKVFIPANQHAGEGFILLKIDPEERVGDLTPDDDLESVAITIKNLSDEGPDLSFCNLLVGGVDGNLGEVLTYEQGETLMAQVCMMNRGNQPLAMGSYSVYLSSDRNLSADDLLLSSRSGIALGVQEKVEDEIEISLPFDIAMGQYTLIAVADADQLIAEQREDNNLMAWPGWLSLVDAAQVEGVDLAIRSLSFDQERVYWGQTLTGQAEIVNRGLTAVERNFVVRVTALPVEGGNPIQLRSSNINGIAAGGKEQLQLELPINERLAQGNYRLRVHVDPTNTTQDQNIANNQRTTSQAISLGGEADIDLFASDLSFTPTVLTLPQLLSADAVIGNLGDDPSGPVIAELYISPMPTLNENSILLQSKEIELEAMPSRIRLEAMVPEDIDQQVVNWYVLIRVKPLDSEKNTANNLASSFDPLVVFGATGGCAEDRFEENDTRLWSSYLPTDSSQDLGMCDRVDWFLYRFPDEGTMEVWFEQNDFHSDVTLCAYNGSDSLLGCADAVDTGLMFHYNGDKLASNLFYVKLESGSQFLYGLRSVVIAPEDEPELRIKEVTVTPSVVVQKGRLLLEFKAVCNVDLEASEAILTIETAEGKLLEGNNLQSSVQIPACEAGETVKVQSIIDLPELANGLYRYSVKSNHYANGERRPGALFRIDSEGACETDPLEPNGSIYETAGVTQEAASVTQGEYENLHVCKGDDDWYAVSLQAGQRLDVALTFLNESGDLELAIYAPDGETLLSKSEGLQDRERASVLKAQQTGDYFVRVYLSENDHLNRKNTYKLSINIQEQSACSDDGYEDNNSFTDAALLQDGYHSLVLCPGDEDWFRFALAAGRTISLVITSESNAAKLQIYSPQNELVGEDLHRVTWTTQTNGQYRARVLSESATEALVYSLQLGGVSGVDLGVSELSYQPHRLSPGADFQIQFTASNLLGDSADEVTCRYTVFSGSQSASESMTLGEQKIALAGAESKVVTARLQLPQSFAFSSPILQVEIDPERQYPDLEVSNNTASLPLIVANACVDDDPRSNEGYSTATALELEDFPYNAVICAYTEDWYKVTLDAGKWKTAISFDAGISDLDLEVYDSELNLLGQSATTAATEKVLFELDAETELYLRVDGFLDAEGTYQIAVESVND